MKFIKTLIDGVWIVEIEPICDDRGFFARSFCKEEFKKHGLNGDFIQQSISFNKKARTLRGIHFQSNPFWEEKLVGCLSGKIWDVVVDLRPNSKTFMQWFGVEICSKKHNQIYIPKGVAHGFETLEDNCSVFYQMTQPYVAEYSKGFAWNDPVVNIKWKNNFDYTIGKKDMELPLLEQILKDIE